MVFMGIKLAHGRVWGSGEPYCKFRPERKLQIALRTMGENPLRIDCGIDYGSPFVQSFQTNV